MWHPSLTSQLSLSTMIGAWHRQGERGSLRESVQGKVGSRGTLKEGASGCEGTASKPDHHLVLWS